LKSARIPAEKLLASGPKLLAAEHIANVQTSPGGGAGACRMTLRPDALFHPEALPEGGCA